MLYQSIALNGEIPTESSTPLQYTNQISFDHTGDLDIMAITTKPELRQRIREHFVVGTAIKAGVKPKGAWKLDTTFTFSQVTADREGWKKIHACLEIEEDGYYFLQAMGANAVRLTMNGKLAMSSDSNAVNGRFQSVIVPLEKGYYLVDIQVKSEKSGKDAVLLYNTPASGGNGLFLLPKLLYLKTVKY